MKLVYSNLGRRKFLKMGSMALMSPMIIKAYGLVSLAAAKTANAASRSRAAYNRAIDKMLEGFRKGAQEVVGWGTSRRGSPKVTAKALKTYASSSIKFNPFWLDEQYAAGTRWGGLIAFPMYSPNLSNPSYSTFTPQPYMTPECGFQSQLWPGENWEFLKPIRVGDTLRAWYRAPEMTEQTYKDRGDARGFLVKECDCDAVNQDNDVVGVYECYTVRIFYPDGPPGSSYELERYGFTKEELVYLDRLARQREIRGDEIRYWEDVKVGDMLTPVVIGPTNIADIYDRDTSADPEFDFISAIREKGPDDPLDNLLEKEGVVGDEYMEYKGFYYKSAGRHADDIAARREGEPGAFLWGVYSLHPQLCCLTNWIGDDAFVRKFSWRHITRTVVGDASYAKGKVMNKRMENGEYLVDIALWQQDMRGFIVDAAVATVALVSKTQPYPDLKREVSY
jgi:acyl dehydratase